MWWLLVLSAWFWFALAEEFVQKALLLGRYYLGFLSCSRLGFKLPLHGGCWANVCVRDRTDILIIHTSSGLLRSTLWARA